MLARRSLVAVTVASLLLLTGCGAKGGSSSGSKSNAAAALAGLSAELASYEVLTAQPQQVLIGLFTKSGFVSYGTVKMSFSYLGTGAGAPVPGPKTTGSFLLVPPDGAPAPSLQELQAATNKPAALTLPADARGVYESGPVTFDKTGFWQVEISVTVDGATGLARASFQTVTKPSYPAPGEKAIASQNLTLASHDGAPLSAVDSRATKTSVPDPQLHQWTVAKALAEHRPIVIVVSTPLYCQSRFCGPTTDEVAALQKQFSDRAVFIHLEVWRDYQKKVVNKAAAQWVYRDKNLTEPWTFLVGSDGKIIARWQNVLNVEQLQSALEQLPVMPS